MSDTDTDDFDTDNATTVALGATLDAANESLNRLDVRGLAIVIVHVDAEDLDDGQEDTALGLAGAVDAEDPETQEAVFAFLLSAMTHAGEKIGKELAVFDTPIGGQG